MTYKTLNTRIQLKYFEYSDLSTVADKVLLKGEVAAVHIPAGTKTITVGTETKTVQTNPTVLFKVGDGTMGTDGVVTGTAFKDLPWLSALAADVYDWAKKSEPEFLTWLKGALKTGEVSYYVTTDEYNTYKTSVIGENTKTADSKNKDGLTADTAFGKIAELKGLVDENTEYIGRPASESEAATGLYDIVGNHSVPESSEGADDAIAATGLCGEIEDISADIDEIKTKYALVTIGTDEDEEGNTVYLDDVDSETIIGAKLYADKKIEDLTKAYLEIDPENPDENKAVNKLAEVAAWINNDDTGATQIVSDISELKTKLNNIKDTNTIYDIKAKENSIGVFTVDPSDKDPYDVDLGIGKPTVYNEDGKTVKSNATGIYVDIEAGDNAVQGNVDTLQTNVYTNYIKVGADDKMYLGNSEGNEGTVIILSGGSASDVW